MISKNAFRFYSFIISLCLLGCIIACNSKNPQDNESKNEPEFNTEDGNEKITSWVNTMLVTPGQPVINEPFRIVVTGDKNIEDAKVEVTGVTGKVMSIKQKSGGEMPCWRINEFEGAGEGTYKAVLKINGKEICEKNITVSSSAKNKMTGTLWNTDRIWDTGMEELYSAWISSLFSGCEENSSWSALHEVTQNKEQNFLYNYLSLGEDDTNGKNSIIMQPDCADNPFFLRAYFSWKLGLPFGYHECDRGWVGRNPKTGRWITNQAATTKTDPVQAFNTFLRRLKDGVQSGTARTALNDENSDYYPVLLKREALRPGVVYADPYGHTLTLIKWVPQTSDHPGLLLAVDAQPDGTVGVKRFWKGNFLFNTSGVVGEPGFKAFRPIKINDSGLSLMKNIELSEATGFIPFSLQQGKMGSDTFYHIMERLINPKPLNPEDALLNLIQALHEQLIVRVTSVANGEAYFKSNPGSVIPMPSSAAGIFLAGGQWENFSTPNRDLRLLIAIDAVLNFPDVVAGSPSDFDIPRSDSQEEVRNKLQALLDKKASGLSITYCRTDGSLQKLTLSEIFKRRDAFEMAYNPNDGIEIRWGAPENSEERSTCRRHAPSRQLETMKSVRHWFNKRLHPPT